MIFRKRPKPEPEELISEEPQYPHCDSRILHAPSECEFCDRHPDWQQLRKRWGIAFTGHEPKDEVVGELPYQVVHKQLPCPADFNRPAESPSDHRQWPGNVAWKDPR